MVCDFVLASVVEYGALVELVPSLLPHVHLRILIYLNQNVVLGAFAALWGLEHRSGLVTAVSSFAFNLI